MAGERKLTVVIAGDAKGLDKAVGSAEKSIGGLDKTTTGFSKSASLGLAAVGVGALAMGKSFVDAASESQQVTKQTEAVLKSMGNQAGVTAQDVAGLADELSKKSGVDDELIQSGQNVLLTFGNVRNEVGKGNDVFTQATTLALDMSVALGQDLSGANIMLGKALNDPIAGITALTRSGVSFTQQQKDQIRTLVESGDSLGAQKIILSELDKQFGGSAEAQATASDKMGVAWGNLQEQIGGILLPAFESVIGVATDVLGVFQSLPEPLQKIAVIGGTAGAGILGIAGAASFSISHLRNMRENLGGMAPALTNATGGLTRFGTVLGGLGIITAVVGLVQLAKSFSDATVDVDAFSTAIQQADAAERMHMGTMLLKLHEWGRLDDAVAKAAETNAIGAQRMVEAAEAAGLSAETVAELRGVIDEKTQSNTLATVEQERNNEATRAAVEAERQHEQTLQDVANALRAQFDPLFAAQDATLRLKEAQDAAAAATRDHGAGSREAAAANDAAVRAALGYESALLQLQHAVEEEDVSLSDATATVQRWARESYISRDAAAQVVARFRELNTQADKMDGRVVTITMREVRQNISENNPLYRAAGGPVPSYLGAGGFPGHARGADTVPAWLSPGEYVINRAAASEVGRPMLDALNSGRVPRGGSDSIVIHTHVVLGEEEIGRAVTRWQERRKDRNGY